MKRTYRRLSSSSPVVLMLFCYFLSSQLLFQPSTHLSFLSSLLPLFAPSLFSAFSCVFVSFIDIQSTLQISPLASVSDPDERLWRSGYLLAVVFVDPCWLRVILRPEEKTDAGTAVAASAVESRPSSGPTAAGEELHNELQLSGRKEEEKMRGEERRVLSCSLVKNAKLHWTTIIQLSLSRHLVRTDSWFLSYVIYILNILNYYNIGLIKQVIWYNQTFEKESGTENCELVLECPVEKMDGRFSWVWTDLFYLSSSLELSTPKQNW